MFIVADLASLIKTSSKNEANLMKGCGLKSDRFNTLTLW